MNDWIQWLTHNWLLIATPVLVFLGSLVVGIWLRRFAYAAFERWTARLKWEGRQLTVEITRRAFLQWFLLLGIYIAVLVSVLPPEITDIVAMVLGSLFVLSFVWIIIRLSEKLIKMYLGKTSVPAAQIALAVNSTRIIVIVIGVLIVLEIWGAPTTPIILLLATAIFVAGLALRDYIPGFFSGAQLAWGKDIRVGHFIKLESGEAGYITAVNWRKTELKTLEGNLILIPNTVLARTKITNYGHAPKRTSDPFRFFTHLHQRELTGLRAATLQELVDILKKVPDSVVYCHTHSFLEEHNYLTPEPANDFALWVSDVLGNEVLGERLASIDIFDFPVLEALKMRLVDIIQDYLSNNKDGHKAPEGREFHFIRSTSIILPTPYVAYDLREFVEVMKKITVDSFYFHVFDARLRLHKSTNDFSIWIETCLGEKELAEKIARLDPYLYTLENLRETVIKLIEEYR